MGFYCMGNLSIEFYFNNGESPHILIIHQIYFDIRQQAIYFYLSKRSHIKMKTDIYPTTKSSISQAQVTLFELLQESLSIS